VARRPAILFWALLCGAPAASAAAEIGTLFHTPEERARLDQLRRGETPEAAPAPGEARTPAVTGYVRRSDGRNTVWVDGAPLATRDDPRKFDPRTLPKRAPAPPAGKESSTAQPTGKEGAAPPAAREAPPPLPPAAASPTPPKS
jgi:hypothetical protein